MMKIHKVIKLLLQLYLILVSVEVFAEYGDSCPSTPLPPAKADDYLKNGTAYGHIIYNIDMREISDGCEHSDPQFKFCLKQAQKVPGKNRIRIWCKAVTLNVGETKTLGDLDATHDPYLGGNYLLKDIPLTVKIMSYGQMCLTMPTSRGEMPVACKPTILPPPPPLPSPSDESCKLIGNSCYSGPSKSQSLFNFSGVAVECVKETLDKVFFQYNKCNTQEMNLLALNPFANFQESLKASVRMALILYVMFFGVNMILSKEYGNLDKIASFMIKLLLVAYFAVGIGPIYFKEGKETQANGMLEYGLPLLTKIAPQFAQIIFNASGSKGLCEFDLKKYKNGYSHYGIWDAIDCRIGYYLGLDALYNSAAFLQDIPSAISGDLTGDSITFPTPAKYQAVDALKTPGTFRFFSVMFGFFMGGNIIVVAAGIAFCVIFTSIVLYFLTNYLVCLITIYVMTYISPIFIPMALFTRTKAYFDSWLKICISCALQPAVIAGFIALLVTMYDSAIYNTCQFVRHDYSYNDDTGFSTFEIRSPKFDPEDGCKSSAGYKLLKYYSGYGWEEHLFLLFSIKYIAKDSLSLLVSLLYVLVFSVIFYYFSKSIGQFASEVTGGPNMDHVVASPTKVVDMVKKGAAYVKAAAEASAGKMPEKNPAASRKGGEEAKGSAEGNEASDKSGTSSPGG